MIRFSTGLRNYVLGTGSFKGGLASCFIDFRTGQQPSSADEAPTGTLLGTVSVNHDGVTGGTWGTAAAGVIDKASAENWQLIGVAVGTAGWFRIRLSGDSGALSTTDRRVDGSIASSGADLNGDASIAVGTLKSIDTFPVDLAANA